MSFLSVLHGQLEAVSRMFSLGKDEAFPVWVAKVVLGLDDDDAFDALRVEGPNEKGMDLFWIDQENRRVFLAQCKYSATGTSRPRMKDLTNFLSCTDWLANPKALEREGRPELVAAAEDYQDAIREGYVVELWFVYCGNRDENIDKRIRVYNDNPENRQHNRTAIHCDFNLLQVMHEEARGEGRRIEEATIRIKEHSEVSGSFGKGLVTSITAPELISLYEEFEDQLFARNVRMWLGARKGSVNAGIIATVEDEKERGNFWAYNNGITIVCDDYDYDDRTGELTLSNFSIVNGCQTTVALARSRADVSEDVFLLARIILPPDPIINSIIQFTNTQNPIRSWDLVSQDPTQRRLKREFEALNAPIYYAIRRGDWASRSPAEKRKFRVTRGRGWRTIKHDLLAQYLASFSGRAVVAYKNKAFLFDRFYEQTFPADLRVEEALFVWKAGERTQELVREEIRREAERAQRGEKHRDKYVLMLKRGGRFYALAVFGLVAKLRNGPDYLRSITEERIISKGASERIDKYARVSIQWYKQAVDDILQITGTDLSVLIREQDFFNRVADRVTNLYETMSISEEWLVGALPKLY